jgi:transcriptional regulator with XRE-family HTH domain
MVEVCKAVDPVTREGLILVVQPPPIDDTARRNELADFLKKRRAGLQPEDIGLPNSGGRRRTPGLRREEVALVAGVGTTWYTWLEQGRDVRASLDVFESLARTLKLTPAERSHLITLGRGDKVPPPPAVPEYVSPTLRRLIDNLGPTPAYLLGRRWDLLAWNDAYAAVFGDPMDFPPGKRNHVWLLFMDPGRRNLLPDWNQGARRILARFRADYAQHVGNPSFDKLVAALNEGSPEFRKWWPQHEVLASGEGRKTIMHPTAGKLLFEHAGFRHGENPEQRLLLYSPLPEEDTPAKLARLLRKRELRGSRK